MLNVDSSLLLPHLHADIDTTMGLEAGLEVIKKYGIDCYHLTGFEHYMSSKFESTYTVQPSKHSNIGANGIFISASNPVVDSQPVDHTYIKITPAHYLTTVHQM